MEIFRKMSFADSTGDAIPFYHDGVYHIFSLTPPVGTTVYPERLRTTWSHTVSKDLIHWEELPTAIYPGEGEGTGRFRSLDRFSSVWRRKIPCILYGL